jgi:hypothetical protein
MTCREFKDAATSLPVHEFLQAPDATLLSHARDCQSCEGWMRDHHRLAGGLHALRVTTADREAAPAVEQALLRAFRQGPSAIVETATPRWNPFALRLSHWFEAGAYVAAAAALALAVFLGYRTLQQPTRGPVAHSVPATAQRGGATSPVAPNSGDAAKPREVAVSGRSRGVAGTRAAARSGSQSSLQADQTRAGYIDLMFCDPLSCSNDAHVVRMELPAAGAGDSQIGSGQTVMADVVVGDDGLVRAVRIVN